MPKKGRDFFYFHNNFRVKCFFRELNRSQRKNMDAIKTLMHDGIASVAPPPNGTATHRFCFLLFLSSLFLLFSVPNLTSSKLINKLIEQTPRNSANTHGISLSQIPTSLHSIGKRSCSHARIIFAYCLHIICISFAKLVGVVL